MTLTESVATGAERTGKASRFGARWRLIGAGLSNVWRYGDLELPAVSGRLLLRGPNGTGKTTALEVLWPFLLDLKQERLSAGKARFTNLTNLMREGAESTNRVGYLWASFAAPGDNHVVSYGVRLNFSKSGTPPVKVIPFFVPGRPLHELAVWGPARQALTADGFRERCPTPAAWCSTERSSTSTTWPLASSPARLTPSTCWPNGSAPCATRPCWPKPLQQVPLTPCGHRSQG